MPPKWDNPSQAARVIAHIDELIRVNDEGDIAYEVGKDLRVDMGLEVLVGLAEKLGEDLPNSERKEIVRHAVFSAKKAEDLTADRVLDELEDQQISFRRRPEERYVLLTSLSIRYFEGLANAQVSGARITLTRNPPERFERPEMAVRVFRNDRYKIPKQFTTARVHVHAKSPENAVETALDRLDFLRGLWNYGLTYRRQRQSFGIGHKPVNEIVLGPIHTLHKPDGTPIEGTLWWQPNYVPDMPSKDIKSIYEAVKERERWARNRVLEATFEGELQDLVVQYVQALDETDLHSVFLRLWGVLEGLTGLTPKDPLTVAVDRTKMLYDDPDYEGLVLNRLREVRNEIVHSGHETEHVERLVYGLKGYVDTVLQYVLIHVDEWKSISDFGSFLSLLEKAENLRSRHHYDHALDLLSDE